MIKKIIRNLAVRQLVKSKHVQKDFNFFFNLFYKIIIQIILDLDFPIQINIETTRACNLDCPFCARLEVGEGSSCEFKMAQNIIDEATNKGKTTLFALHMWGEPMLNPELTKIIRYIKGQKIFHGASLTTNGILLDKKKIYDLLNSKIDQIIISLHTFDEIEYKNRVGKNIDLNLVLTRIKNLLSERKKRKSTTQIIIRIFETSERIRNYQYKIDEFEKLGAIIENDEYDNSAGDRKIWSQKSSKKVSMHQPIEKQENKRWPCYHPWLTLTVNYKGLATICCVDSKMDMMLGNSGELPISSMWKSPEILEMRKSHLKNDFDNICKICDGCDTWKSKPNFFFDSQLIKNK